jgi:Undecaprenyl-phosphate galactose phosphotransferase WbaP
VLVVGVGKFMETRSTATPLSLIPATYERLRDTKVGYWKLSWGKRLVPAVLVLADVLLSLVIWWGAAELQGIWGRGALSPVTEVVTVAWVSTWVGLRALLGLYPGYGLDSAEQLRRHTYVTFATLGILAIFAFTAQIGLALSRLLLGLVFLGLLTLAPFVQHLAKLWLRKAGLWGKRVVVLGYKEAGANVVELLREEWGLGYDPVAVFDYRLDTVEASFNGFNDQRALDGVVNLARECSVDTVIFAMPHIRREQLSKLVGLASLTFRHVWIVPNLGGLTNAAVVARNLSGTFAVEIRHNLLVTWALRVKRTMDLVATVVGAALILPLLVVLALLVYLESGGPVFYRAERIGKNGELFSCLKFRTMVLNAEAFLQQILEDDAVSREEYAKYHKLREDPRVTRVGRFLRKTSLDELPQLWNVVRGEMSLVGPRPYLPRESDDIGITSQSEILRVPPGMTGLWQVSERNRAFFDKRVQMDTYYVRDWSIWLDLVLLARTVKILLSRGAAY